MNIKFVDEARFEFLDAISYYEEQQAGLGRRFKAELSGVYFGSLNIQKFVRLDRTPIED